jgi:bifunctional non-homologous end joining protein LigD
VDLRSGQTAKREGSKKKPDAGTAQGRGAVEPDFIAPELATLATAVPDAPGWLHEVKFDGYRIMARKAGGAVTLFSRSGLDWTVRFPAVARALAELPCKSALLDGEVAFVLPSGLTDFKSLQEHIDSDHPAIRYYVFDLLELDGEDLRDAPLAARKARLKTLMTKTRLSDRLVYSDDIDGNGKAFFAQACAAGLEGIVSKRANGRYRSGRSKDWLKIKCGQRAEFVIGGYAKSGVRGRPFASLLLGTYQGERLIFAGKVGTGFNAAEMKRLAVRFKLLARKASPFQAVPAAERRDAVWLEPKLVCEVAFTEWTRDGRLRHPSFQGLREDKPAGDVVRDAPAKTPGAEPKRRKAKAREPQKRSAARAAARRDPVKAAAPKGDDDRFAGITLTHPDRVLYPDLGLTKLELAEYYESVADWMMPYLVNRPISLVRCPEGTEEECFFQRHAMKGMSKAIKEIAIPGGSSRQKYLYVDDKAGLFGLVQIGVLEIHDWGVSLKAIERPDRVVFDLDPDQGLDFETLKAAVVETRDFLADLGLTSFLKATGGKGFHVVAPLIPKAGWDEVKAFCKAIADALVTARGDRYTANMAKQARGGKIFVDYLRNQRGGSAIVNFSTRSRKGAPVASPLRWDELAGLSHPAPYTVETMPARLKRLKSDPWAGFFQTRQSITAKAKKALGL